MQIMIIDNDPYIRESLSLFFNSVEQHFLIFKNACEGLNALKYQDIDVVISDYFLPDMNGLDFLIQVARDCPKAARIMMATVSSEDLKNQSEKAGIDMFIEKPLSVASIDHVIKTVMASPGRKAQKYGEKS